MAHVSIDELLKQCGSVYKLVILAAKRAKEMADGSPPLVSTKQRKVTSIALEEILQGKVLYQTPASEGDSGKPARGAKQKEEKKKRTST